MVKVNMVSRSGRHLQRYNGTCRQVVGCIPYRYTKTDQFSSVEDLEVLLISSQKSQRMMFPKGGWELDESMEDAALRETVEEAGVRGKVERELGKWAYLSKRGGIVHEGYMFPMLVNEQLDFWPEKDLRKRRWMSVAQAREVCQYSWMKEALDKLVHRQREMHLKQNEEKDEARCT
ncbi:Dihydroneopterin triphosphate diphosphatase [Trema orientale]|uniref:Dihydroneopterin triphosphate diphosphatase n=1 Tax=Trema orientale TaxID=63057 RepID=A0A2P5CI59_TREOI|nr:Dihydroneopterin triphosphate diphosphatase [Trema orientale]